MKHKFQWWRIPVALLVLLIFLSPLYILISVAFRGGDLGRRR